MNLEQIKVVTNKYLLDDLRKAITDNRVCAEVEADDMAKYLLECILFYKGNKMREGGINKGVL